MPSAPPAWQTDELSEEWIPQPASQSTKDSTALDVDGGSHDGSVVVRRHPHTQDHSHTSSQPDPSYVEGSHSDVVSGGSVVVNECSNDDAGRNEPAPWVKAAVEGLGGMFGPHKLERMFHQGQSSARASKETHDPPPDPTFMTPSAAIKKRSQERGIVALDESSFSFQAQVPSRIPWKDQPHFATRRTPEPQEHHNSSEPDTDHLFEPTPKPNRTHFEPHDPSHLDDNSVAGQMDDISLPEQMDGNMVSEDNSVSRGGDTEYREESHAFAQETPAPKRLTSDGRFPDLAASRSFRADDRTDVEHDRLFISQYDTFTRDHLSRLVEEIDDLSSQSASAARAAVSDEMSDGSSGPAHSTPPQARTSAVRETSDLRQHAFRAGLTQQRDQDRQWSGSFCPSSDYAQEAAIARTEQRVGPETDQSSVRGAKRIRLSDLASQQLPGLAGRQRDSLLVLDRHQSKLKRSWAQSSTRRNGVRFRSDPNSRSTAAVSTQLDNGLPAPSNKHHPQSSLTAKPGKRDLLAEAKALMARIKAKSSQEPMTAPIPDRHFSNDDNRNPSTEPIVHRTIMDVALVLHSPDLSEVDESEFAQIQHDRREPSPSEGDHLYSDMVDRADWDEAASSLKIPTPRRIVSPRKLLRRISSTYEPEDDAPARLERRRSRDFGLDPEIPYEDGDSGEAESVQSKGEHQRFESAAAASLRQALLDAPESRPTSRPVSTIGSSTSSLISSAYSSINAKRHFATQPFHHSPGHKTRPALSLSAGVLPTGTGSLRTASTATAVTMTASTAKLSVMSSHSVLAQLAHQQARGHGLMTIAPEDVEDLLNQGRVGKMVFDATSGRWMRARRASTSGQINSQCDHPVPPVEIITEDVDEEEDGSISEEDIFKDIESLNSRRDMSIQENVDRQELDVDSHVEDDEVASDQEHGEDLEEDGFELESLKEFDAVEDPVVVVPAPPRSVLKVRSEGFLDSPSYSRIDDSKAGRSVSFSDGRLQGKIVGLKKQTLLTPNVAKHDLLEDYDRSGQPSARTRGIELALDQLQLAAGGTPSSQATSNSSSLLALSTSRKVRAKALRKNSSSASNCDSPTTPTMIDANATFLTECSFGISHDRLLKAITDVEPFEPNWDQMKVIDLGGKGLDTLIRLKEWLPNLDELNLETNLVCYLTGLPACLRTLLVPNNRLTSVTSFKHLPNLERLDISNNQIDSVLQLSCLQHLRELKADFNQISSLDGLTNLDGLTKLSLKGNQLSIIRCAETTWTRLEVLNLSRNSIGEVIGLEKLICLHLLNLDHNDLYSLNVEGQLGRLRVLRLCHNHIESLNVECFPNLRTLFVDACELEQLQGASRLRKLENLSVRDQRRQLLNLPTKHIRDIKRLYLSGNRLPTGFPTHSFFNLVYLELAMCQCSSLPNDLAQAIPNVRTLNLNYNFLTDLTAISGLSRLQKLTVLGSRLKTCGRGVLEVLQSLPEIELLDLRMNPATLAFYPPLLVEDQTQDVEVHADYRIVSSRARWSDIDGKFRRSLPNEYYLRRATYRGFTMQSCPRLRMLDGLVVDKGERARMVKLLKALSRKVERGDDLLTAGLELSDVTGILPVSL